MFCVYVLKSRKNFRYYIGSCEDVKIRLNKHNKGQVRATKAGVPWNVVYQESFQTRAEAVRREIQLKSYKGGEAFKRLLNSNGEIA